MLINPLVNRVTSLTNVGGPIGTRDNVYPFHIPRVYRILHRSQGLTNGAKGPKGRRDIMFLKSSCNLVSGPLNKRKMDTRNPILRFPFSKRIPGSFEESFLTYVSTITILNKDIKEMGFFFLKALFIRDP